MTDLLCNTEPAAAVRDSVSVVIAEDSVLVREGMRAVLSAATGVFVVGVCGDGEQLQRAVIEHEPLVVVSDIRMPPGRSNEGIQIAQQLRRERPHVGVVVLSSANVAQYALDLLEGGSPGRAYLLKERLAQPGELVSAVREVAAGGSVIDPAVVDGLIRAQGRSVSSPLARLSPRELDVLGEMAMGHTNPVIAQRLSLTLRGVQRQINSVFAKLDLTEDAAAHHRVRTVLLYLCSH